MKMKLIDLINDAYGCNHSLEAMVDLVINTVTFSALVHSVRPTIFKKHLVAATEREKLDLNLAVTALHGLGLQSQPHNKTYVNIEIDKSILICQKFKELSGINGTDELYQAMVNEAGKFLAIWVYTAKIPRVALGRVGTSAAYGVEVLEARFKGDSLKAVTEMIENGNYRKTENLQVFVQAADTMNKWCADAINKQFEIKAKVYSHFVSKWANCEPVELEDDGQYEVVEELSGVAALQKIFNMQGDATVITSVSKTKPAEAQWLLDNAEVLFNIDKQRMAELEERVRHNHE